MLNIKEKDILQFLIKNKERFVTSKELAEYLSCSDRTVRNVLKLIEKTMIIQGVRLISKQGQGYQIFLRIKALTRSLDKLMNWKKTIRKLQFQKVMIV